MNSFYLMTSQISPNALPAARKIPSHSITGISYFKMSLIPRLFLFLCFDTTDRQEEWEAEDLHWDF